MNELPPTIADAYAIASGELGMFSAARLFVREIASLGGAPLLVALRDLLGKRFPVLDVVATSAIDGVPLQSPDPQRVIAACDGLARLLIVGIEADGLDVLLPRLPRDMKVGLVLEQAFEADVARVLANYEKWATRCDLSDVGRFAGARAGLLTFVYGTDGFLAAVPPAWLRVVGADVRTTFRSIVGWNLLGDRMDSYPRWLAETTANDFSTLVGASP